MMIYEEDEESNYPYKLADEKVLERPMLDGQSKAVASRPIMLYTNIKAKSLSTCRATISFIPPITFPYVFF